MYLDKSVLRCDDHLQQQLCQVQQQQQQQVQQQQQQQHHQGVFLQPQVLSADIRCYHDVFNILNLDPVFWSAEKYINKFGVITEQHRFGDKVWPGMLDSFSREYSYKYNFTGGDLMIGWFMCPCHFSKANALQPPQAGDTVWYPAVFCDKGGDVLLMACLHIVLLNSRPWHVYRGRTLHLRFAVIS